MSDEDEFPAWGENATKGDLIRAIVYLRSNVTALAGALVAVQFDKSDEFQTKMDSYFQSAGKLDQIIDEIAGKSL